MALHPRGDRLRLHARRPLRAAAGLLQVSSYLLYALADRLRRARGSRRFQLTGTLPIHAVPDAASRRSASTPRRDPARAHPRSCVALAGGPARASPARRVPIAATASPPPPARAAIVLRLSPSRQSRGAPGRTPGAAGAGRARPPRARSRAGQPDPTRDRACRRRSSRSSSRGRAAARARRRSRRAPRRDRRWRRGASGSIARRNAYARSVEVVRAQSSAPSAPRVAISSSGTSKKPSSGRRSRSLALSIRACGAAWSITSARAAATATKGHVRSQARIRRVPVRAEQLLEAARLVGEELRHHRPADVRVLVVAEQVVDPARVARREHPRVLQHRLRVAAVVRCRGSPATASVGARARGRGPP